MARASDTDPADGFAWPGPAPQRAAVNRQRDRMRRAAVIWERQRADFLRLLVESMTEFGISQTELNEERRKLARAGRGGKSS